MSLVPVPWERGCRARAAASFAVPALIALTLLVAGPATTTAAAPVVPPGLEIPMHSHEGDDEDGATHAADDLADTSITQIEKKTNENRKKFEQAGVMQRQSAAAEVVADPGVSGQWSSVIDTEVVPIFQAVLPNGKVLMWDSVGDAAAEDYPDHTFTRAMVWNPADDSYKRVDVQGYNIFCAGFAHLQNGNILVAGGNKNAALEGIVQTHIFNWQTETWSLGKNMAAGRWYPSLATMANGELSIIGGGPARAEVYQTNGAIRPLPGFTNAMYGGRIYPFMGSRPDTLLQLYGPYNTMYSINSAGGGVVTGAAGRDSRYRYYGSFATYGVGKTLVIGGGSLNEEGTTNSPTRSTVILDTNTGLVPTVTNTNWLPVRRIQHNATVIADGTVLVTGGLTSNTRSPGSPNAVKSAIVWDPANPVWKELASANRVREYHSAATLLPDGRVLTGGGGVCGGCMANGYLEKNIEYFSPPYLYKKDGSGALASRPAISSAPTTININSAFTVASDQAATIAKIGIVGLSDTTHSVNQGQRYVPLRFNVSGTTLTVTGPPTGGVAPPGYYMLFIVDSDGVPSIAEMVQVAKGPAPVMSPIKNSASSYCATVLGGSLAIRTYIATYSCTGTVSQAMSRMPNDKSIRVLGNCLDVPGYHYVSGARIWTYTCNNGTNQKWEFRTDGTIRPVGKNTLCLMAATTGKEANITIATCNGSKLQRWSW